jgi:acyl-coenzyme A thioesterase PaaI-like protein
LRPSEKPAIQDYYPDDFAHCFGCGRNNANGHLLKSFVEENEVTARFTPAPYHLSVPGFVYGGLIASLIDCHAMATAAARTELDAGRAIGTGPAPRFVTAALRVDYLKPTPTGVELELRAKVTDKNERKSVVAVSVFAEGQMTAKGEVVAVPMPKTMQRPERQ